MLNLLTTRDAPITGHKNANTTGHKRCKNYWSQKMHIIFFSGLKDANTTDH